MKYITADLKAMRDSGGILHLEETSVIQLIIYIISQQKQYKVHLLK